MNDDQRWTTEDHEVLHRHFPKIPMATAEGSTSPPTWEASVTTWLVDPIAMGIKQWFYGDLMLFFFSEFNGDVMFFF